jgi:ArsR family transcriptional regulator, virulence genes transcriptional regulator
MQVGAQSSPSQSLEELRGKADEVASLLKALSHSDRLLLLCELASFESRGGRTVSELTEACGISQSLTSQFLGRLRSEGWVSARREGQNVRYQISDPRVGELLATLKKLFCKPDHSSPEHS